MTAQTISPLAARSGASWVGRSSQRRRQQVSRAADGDRVQPLWDSLVDVLRAIESPSSALLCTADGFPLAAYGLRRTDLPKVSSETGSTFAARAEPTVPGTTEGVVETVELSAGQRHTVIASVPGPTDTNHLLAVTAEGVSLPLLEAWTRRAAEDLREVLSAEAS